MFKNKKKIEKIFLLLAGSYVQRFKKKRPKKEKNQLISNV